MQARSSTQAGFALGEELRSGARIRVLILEDNRADARLMSLVLDQSGLAHESRLASGETEFTANVEWADVVLADHGMPEFGAVGALGLLAKRRRDLPLVVVSGDVGEEAAAEAIRLGAEDYVHKDRIARLGPAVRRALEHARERRRYEAERSERLRAAEVLAHVTRALTGEASLDEMLQSSATGLVECLDVAFARIWTLDEAEPVLVLRASAGLYTGLDGGHSRIPVGRWKIGRIASERRPHLTNDVLHDPRISHPDWARKEGMTAFAGHPLEVDGRLLGVIGMFSRRSLGEPTLTAIATVAREIALGIERKRIASELERRRLDLENLFRASPTGVAINRASDGTFVEVNDDFLRAVGYERPEVIGSDPWRLGIWARRDVLRAVRRELAARGVVSGLETELRTRDGSVLPVLYSAVMLTFGSEPVVASFVRDVGDLKRAERRLREALERAEQSDRLKTAFLENMSHEFRTPLNVILGYNELIAERLAETGDDEARDLADAVARASKRLLRSLHAVLDLSRFSTGTYVVHLGAVDVGAVMRLGIETAAPVAERKGLALRAVVETERTTTAHDEDCLVRAIDHLLENAIKFTERGSVEARLLRDASDRLVVEIRDTGIGIDAEYVSSLFEPFTQESLGRTRNFEGLGIGLALVRHYLRAGGAEISVETAKGRGTTFRIRFAPDPPSARRGVPGPVIRSRP